MADLPKGWTVVEDTPAPAPAEAPASALPSGWSVVDTPAPSEGPGLASRILNAADRGLGETLDLPQKAADAVLAPVNSLIDKGLSAIGVDTSHSETPLISKGMEQQGIGVDTKEMAPQSTAEKYAQSIARAAGQNAPFAAFAPAGALGAFAAGEAGAAVGQGVAGEAARREFPNSPIADSLAQLAGGLSGAALTHLATALFQGGRSVKEIMEATGGKLNEDEVKDAVAHRDSTGDTRVDVRPAEVIEAPVPAEAAPTTEAPVASVQEAPGAPAPEVPQNDFNPAEAPQISPEVASLHVEQGLPNEAATAPAPLDAGTLPPVTPKEELSAGPYDEGKYASNINTERLETTPQTEQYLREATDGIDLGSQTHEDVTKKASKILSDRPVLDILAHDPKLSEAHAYQAAVSTINKNGLDRMKDAADRILDPASDTSAATDDFEKWRYLTALASAKNSGNAQLAGRLLEARKIRPGDDQGALARSFSKMGEDFGKLDSKEFASLVQKHRNDPTALNKLAVDSYKAHWEDYALSAWYNSMLSGPLTHMRNIVGNASNFVWDIGEHTVAAGIGKLRGGTDRVTIPEVDARIQGVIDALRDSKTYSNSAEAYRKGQNLSLKGDNPHVSLSDLAPKGIGKKIGKGLEYGTRGLAAEDEFFRNIFTSSAYHGEAYRAAVAKGLKGQDLSDRVAYLIQNPTKKMDDIAEQYGRRLQFVDDPSPIGKVIQALKTNKVNATYVDRIGKVLTNIVIPFARVTDSTVRTVLRRSPLGFLDRYNRADFLAGGARRDLAIARVALGSTALGAVAYAADKGIFTGNGPDDFRKRGEAQAGGWMPNAIKLGDTYHSLSGLSPAANQINIVAGLVEKYKSGELKEASFADKMLKMSQTFAKLINDNNFTGDLGTMLSAVSNGGRGDGEFKNYISNLASSVTTPAILRQTNQTFGDQKTRDTTGDGSLSDAISGRVLQDWSPDSLPVKSDIYGNDIKKEGALIRSSSTDRGPVVAELQRLAAGDKTLVTPAPKTVTIGDGFKMKLSAPEYEQYQKLTGQTIQQGVAEAMGDPRWKDLSDEDKRGYVKDIMKDARETARDQMFPS